MSTHTPGPWQTFGPVKFTVYGGDPRVRIAVIDYCTGAATEEHDANARLIAAAPDLLEALKELLEANVYSDSEGFVPIKYADTGSGERAVKMARAAIAKATDDNGRALRPQYQVIEQHGDWFLLYEQLQVGVAVRHEFRIQKAKQDIARYPGITLVEAKKHFHDHVKRAKATGEES